jgi:hypothetical protein
MKNITTYSKNRIPFDDRVLYCYVHFNDDLLMQLYLSLETLYYLWKKIRYGWYLMKKLVKIYQRTPTNQR